MDITINKVLTDNVYRVTILTGNFSTAENTLLSKFGEPEIEIAGTITDDSGLTFALNTSSSTSITMKTGFLGGVTQEFDGDDYDDAKQRADAWASTIRRRITEAFNTLRARYDGFSGTETISV